MGTGLPGDSLDIEIEVLETTAESDSRGLAEIETTTYAERESGGVEKVSSFVGLVMFGRKRDE